jgi:hypothetical protein
MKYFLVIIFLVFAGCTTIRKQVDLKKYRPLSEFNKDTIAYLRYNFITNKDKYVNKKVSLLVKDLEIQVKSFTLDHDGRTHSSDGVNLNFDDLDMLIIKAPAMNPNEPFLNLTFINSMPDSIALPMLKRGNQKFTKEERDYLGEQVIKNIRLPYKFQ